MCRDEILRIRLEQAILLLESTNGSVHMPGCSRKEICLLCSTRAIVRNPQSDGESLQLELEKIRKHLEVAFNSRFGVVSFAHLAETLLHFASEKDQTLQPLQEELVEALYF